MKPLASLSADLAGFGARVAWGAPAVVRHYGLVLQTAVMRNASLPRSMERWYSREGVRAVTGDYRRSITVRFDGRSATVGSNRPQARRLELGFAGVDALGRRVHQPPYPHFRPALFEVEPQFFVAVGALVKAAKRG